jgi:hypothetical protein
VTDPAAASWDLAWRRLVAACAEARRRLAAGDAPAASGGGPAEYPPVAPPPTPSPDRPVIRDDLARLAALSRAYLLTYASAGPAVTVGLLVTSRGPGDLAFGVNVLPETASLPPGAIGPAVALEASRALLTAPILRTGRLIVREGGALAFEPAGGFEPSGGLDPGGQPRDLPGLILGAYRAAPAPPE